MLVGRSAIGMVEASLCGVPQTEWVSMDTDADRIGPLHLPPSWSSDATAPPPSPVPERRMASASVASVLQACKKIDNDASLASATYTQDGHTLVRIRSGISGSVNTIQRALQRALPLAVTDVTDSALDGTCEASVTVLNQHEESRQAWRLAAGHAFPRLLQNAGLALLLLGVGVWASALLETHGTSGDAREL